MKTPFEKFSYEELLNRPIMLDANILMLGVNDRSSNPDYSFERMEELIYIPLIENCTQLLIHEKVYEELDAESKKIC